MCQDYHKNSCMSYFLLNFFDFCVCFVGHTIETSIWVLCDWGVVMMFCKIVDFMELVKHNEGDFCAIMMG